MKRVRVEQSLELNRTRRPSYKSILYFALSIICFTPGISVLIAQTDALPPGGIKLQIVSFGDSLQDAGTYAPFAEKNFGGGIFTTNPGKIWSQQVAAFYGDTLKPAFVGGFGQPLQPAGGLGFAQGGARVSEQPGISHAASGTPNADYALQTTIPVAEQLSRFLSMHGGFQPNQLILINGGANDMLFHLQASQTDSLKWPASLLEINKAAIDLAEVVDKVIKAGGKHIVLLNLADFGLSPDGVASHEGTVVTEVVKVFNETLKVTLLLKGDSNKVILIDDFSFLDQVIANYKSYGFITSNTGIACNPQAEIAIAKKLGMNNPEFYDDALFCSQQTLSAPNAEQTYIFADSVHPSTHYSTLLAQFVERQIAASGLGK